MDLYSIFLQKRVFSITRLLTIGIIVMIIILGCFENYGRLRRSTEVQNMFEIGQLPSEYNYHFYGLRSRPFAVMDLKSDWTLRSKQWRNVELSTEEFRYMTKWVWEDLGYYKYGAEILDPEFVKIGIIYTSSFMVAVKVDKDAKIVEVMPHAKVSGDH